MKEVVRWGGEVKPAIQNVMVKRMDRTATHSVVTVLTKDNATTSMVPVLMDVIVDIKEVIVLKYAITIPMDQNVR